MKPRSTDRVTSIIVLVSLLVISTIGAFSVIGILASRHLPPASAWQVSVALHYQNEFLFVTEDLRTLQYTIRVVDIPSGRERITDYPVLLPWHGWVTDGNRVWIAGGDIVVELDGPNRTEHRPRRKLKGRICMVFLYEGSLSIIEYDGLYRLLVLADGEWEDRGEITLPGTGRRWAKSEIDEAERLVPLSEEPRPSLSNSSEMVCVIPENQTLHLIHLGSESDVVAYRVGLEFVTRDQEIASALAPENVPLDVTGWKKLDFQVGNFFSSGPSNDGPILATRSSTEEPMRIWGRTPAGSKKTFHVIKEIAGNPWSSVTLASSDNGRIYVVQNRPLLGPRVQEYVNGEWVEFPLKIDTALAQILRWAFRVLAQIAVVLVLGTTLLICVGSRIAQSQQTSYQFAQEAVRLAPLGRRCLARSLDVLFLLIPLILQSLISWPHIHAEQIARFHWESREFEAAFVELFSNLWPAVLAIITLLVVMIWVQSRWGLTPGKWLLKLRTVRTTLRPCGFSRSLLRELLMALDAPLLLTPLPGIMSMLATESRQRLGDLAADTLVIDARGQKSLANEHGIAPQDVTAVGP
jgi:uncharacterized RDD family membrane protein YckC